VGGREPVSKRLWERWTGGRGGRGQRNVATRAAHVGSAVSISCGTFHNPCVRWGAAAGIGLALSATTAGRGRGTSAEPERRARRSGEAGLPRYLPEAQGSTTLVGDMDGRPFGQLRLDVRDRPVNSSA
jgi:hypothetical protein